MFIVVRDDGLVLRDNDWYLNVATVFSSEAEAKFRWSALPVDEMDRSRVVGLDDEQHR